MRIVFFGTGSFAVPALEAVAPWVVLAVSQPDRPSGRGMRLKASPVRQRAVELDLPTATPEKCREPEFIEQVRALEPDFLLVAAYGQILPLALLEASRQGGINLHGSILPKWRGAAPIQRCLQAGDTETGVTLMQMARGMDTGDVIALERLPIGPDETYGELEARLAQLAGSMARQWAPRLAGGDYPRVEQRHEDATHAPKIERSETELHVERDAQSQYNAFRAFTPNPGASLRTRFGMLKLLSARLAEGDGVPGEVLETKPALIVAFGTGALAVLEGRWEGKTRVTGTDLANGVRIKSGDTLVALDDPGPTS